MELNKLCLVLYDSHNKGDDNAEHLYRWVRENHPYVKLYYLLAKASYDWKRLENDGFNLVDVKSKEANKAVAEATHIIWGKNFKMFQAMPEYDGHQKVIWLQHGITHNNVSEAVNNWAKYQDFICCATKREYEHFLNPENGYDINENQLRLTGFARHDRLKHYNDTIPDENIILVQFHWRRHASTPQTFNGSDFQKTINDFLNSDFIKNVVFKYGYKILVKHHPVTEKLTKYITIPDYVEYIDNEVSFQELFAKAKMIITDYSSNAYEMGVIDKPCIYYMPDIDQYPQYIIPNDLKRIGPVAKNMAEMEKYFDDIVNNNFIPLNPYLKNREEYVFHDEHNCERIFNALVELSEPVSDKNIYVAMTSWKDRINYVKDSLISLEKQTLLPTKIFLTLSSEEFPNHMNDLPQDLQLYIYTHHNIVVTWVNENTKTFKKVFPILGKLNDDDIIITFDDDIKAPKDLIKSRINDFMRYNEKYAITPNNKIAKCAYNMNVISVTSVFSAKMLKNWERLVNKTVLNTLNDDRTYLYLLYLNGYKTKVASHYTFENLFNSKYMLSLPSPLSETKQLIMAKRYDRRVSETVKLLTGNSIINSYDFFNIKESINENGKDAVFILGTKSLNNKNDEIKVAIASLRKYCSSWLRNIYVVGENPNVCGIKHIPANDIFQHDKDANIIHKTIIACEKIENLSDDFLLCSDDQFVTCESSFDDFTPRYICEYNPSEQYWINKKNGKTWNKRLCKTLERFGDGAKYFEPHIFSPINKYKFIEMCNSFNYKKEDGIIIFSLYYNFIKEKGVPNFDHKSIFTPPFNIPSNIRHIAYIDKTFKDVRFRMKLNEITDANIDCNDIVSTVEAEYHPYDTMVVNTTERPNNKKIIKKDNNTLKNLDVLTFNDLTTYSNNTSFKKKSIKKGIPKKKNKVNNIEDNVNPKELMKYGLIGWTYNY